MSRYNPDRQHSFFSLPTGSHHFEVRARDDDLNVDPHPATLDFVVLPPVWKQAWFQELVTVFVGIIALQATRIISRGRNLRRTNRALAGEVEERKRIQAEVEQAQKQLLEASRQAGMAEVATDVLHNVGNALNSVNVSADLLVDRTKNHNSIPCRNWPSWWRNMRTSQISWRTRQRQNGPRLSATFKRLCGG